MLDFTESKETQSKTRYQFLLSRRDKKINNGKTGKMGVLILLERVQIAAAFWSIDQKFKGDLETHLQKSAPRKRSYKFANVHIDVDACGRMAGYHKHLETACIFRSRDLGNNPWAQCVPSVPAISSVRAKQAGLCIQAQRNVTDGKQQVTGQHSVSHACYFHSEKS